MCNVIFLSIRGTILLTSFSSSQKGGKKDPVERKHLIMLSFFKSESKSITIPDRPNPPSFDLMKEDVESAPDNDLMFRTRSRKFTWHSAIYNLRKYKPGPYVTYANETAYDYFLSSFIFTGTDSESSDEYFDALSEFDVSGDDDMEAEQEHVYEQAIELLQLHQRLINAPQTLESELQTLKTIGQEVSEAVTDLRQMSHSFQSSSEESSSHDQKKKKVKK